MKIAFVRVAFGACAGLAMVSSATVFAAPSPAQAKTEAAQLLVEIIDRGKQWQECLTGEAVRLGKANNEDASTVVRAAESRCRDSQGSNLNALETITQTHALKLLIAYRSYANSPQLVMLQARQDHEKFLERARDKAVADLLEARAVPEQ